LYCSQNKGRAAEVCCCPERSKNSPSPVHTDWDVPDPKRSKTPMLASREKNQNPDPPHSVPIGCVTGADDETTDKQRSRKQEGSKGGRCLLVSMGNLSCLGSIMCPPLASSAASEKGSANLVRSEEQVLPNGVVQSDVPWGGCKRGKRKTSTPRREKRSHPEKHDSAVNQLVKRNPDESRIQMECIRTPQTPVKQ
jgi:hypothetical protein